MGEPIFIADQKNFLYAYIYICILYFFFISLSIFIEDRHKILIMGRSELKELSEQEFAQIVRNQAVYKLRGGVLMILTSFANLSKFLLPAIRRYVLPAAGSFASGVVKDV